MISEGNFIYKINDKEVTKEEFGKLCSDKSKIKGNVIYSYTSDYHANHPKNLGNKKSNIISLSGDDKFAHVIGILGAEDMDNLFDILEPARVKPPKNCETLQDMQDYTQTTTNLPDFEDVITTHKNGGLCESINNDYWNTYSKLLSGDITYPKYAIKGQKYNQNKLPLDLVITKQFSNALKAVAKCSVYGHDKYKETDADWQNFRKVQGGSQTYADAAQRHRMCEEEKDKESGLYHKFHVAWNALAELEMWMQENNVTVE